MSNDILYLLLKIFCLNFLYYFYYLIVRNHVNTPTNDASICMKFMLVYLKDTGRREKKTMQNAKMKITR